MSEVKCERIFQLYGNRLYGWAYAWGKKYMLMLRAVSGPFFSFWRQPSSDAMEIIRQCIALVWFSSEESWMLQLNCEIFLTEWKLLSFVWMEMNGSIQLSRYSYVISRKICRNLSDAKGVKIFGNKLIDILTLRRNKKCMALLQFWAAFS